MKKMRIGGWEQIMGKLTHKHWDLLTGLIMLTFGIFAFFIMDELFSAVFYSILGMSNLISVFVFGLNNPFDERETEIRQKAISLSYVFTILAIGIFLFLAYMQMIPLTIFSFTALFFICLFMPTLFQLIIRMFEAA